VSGVIDKGLTDSGSCIDNGDGVRGQILVHTLL
jgi:hypothetical protein